ncbi:hypothetical protein SARC_04194 [Sphaeroforma arctica JP610]|uniref:Uncharacterized protein n=1 Tax=Sphaeroforma arctica JP610 TaxID=667725 RepID=A0A0L0G3E7_9EUKA|nr:hypothetical protein SARC_04194 [Sphaeroforma arctica JP610]KNC83570.1 hypothetical protein SARC_04194 [Sphaeroforma arctica JP610]|eukprot:XP_014157472.1 hypothetical protein SARC_04194 [Sphaeroforma arctica JP610]
MVKASGIKPSFAQFVALIFFCWLSYRFGQLEPMDSASSGSDGEQDIDSLANRQIVYKTIVSTVTTTVMREPTGIVALGEDSKVYTPHEGYPHIVYDFNDFYDPWDQKKKREPTKSLVCLTYSPQIESMVVAWKSWSDGGLMDEMTEILVFINMETTEGRQQVMDLVVTVSAENQKKVRVIGVEKNVPIMAAINWAVGNATSDVVLFMEKDFRLIEPKDRMKQAINDGVTLLISNEATVIRYRHRRTPGIPNTAEDYYGGREYMIKNRQPNLVCYSYFWLDNIVDYYPDIMWKCGPGERFFCARGNYCGWTNNPGMFLRSWFVNTYKPTFDYLWTQPREEVNSHLEFNMDWWQYMWNRRTHVVALGDGLFEHKEAAEHGESPQSWFDEQMFKNIEPKYHVAWLTDEIRQRKKTLDLYLNFADMHQYPPEFKPEKMDDVQLKEAVKYANQPYTKIAL